MIQRGVLILLLLLPLMGWSQFEEETPTKFELRGYIKDLRIVNYTKPTGILQDNFFHNRFNFRYYPHQRWTVALEMRNRFFYGETVKLDPTYSERVHQDEGFFNASILWIDEPTFFMHSIFDRGYMSYADDQWEVTLGRQRINWGISSVWNPNDLFNTFNFANFDYEERPGADALRVQRYLSGMSAVEVAIAPDTGKDASVYAGMYRFNKWNYDFQVLSGVYYSDVALGFGWAGNVKLAGIKGEATYFQPKTNWDTVGVINATVGMDYSFRNGLYISGSFLYNSGGVNDPAQLTNPELFSNTISPKSLMPSEWSLFGQSSYTFTPLLSASAALIYAPGINILFAMPSVTYSLATNWELLALGQLYYGEMTGTFNFLGSGAFIRTKFSF